MTFPSFVTRKDIEDQDTLGMLIRLAGQDAAFLIVENWPGQRLFIPKNARPGHRLSNLIGIDAANALCAEFGGLLIKVPLARSWRARVYFERGWSNSRIGLKLGISDNTVVRILSKLGLSRSRSAKVSVATGEPVAAAL